MQKTKKLLTIGITAIVFVWMLAVMPAPASAATIINVPGDYPTIQAAINKAQTGDTVLVANGTYTGSGNKDLDFGGKAITVRSLNGAEWTIIDCEGSGRGFYFHSGEKSSSVVDGFTITNGSATPGVGIYCELNSSPTITNNIITGNGVGIWNDSYSSPTITNNIITDNFYGIYNLISSPTITNNTITGNNDSGIYNYFSSSPTITNNIITNNVVYGIYNLISSPTIDYNDVWGNTTNYSGCSPGDGNISKDPLFLNIFEFTDMTISSKTKKTILVNDASIYEVDEYFEYNNDGVAREIDAIDEGTNMITFSNALDSNSEVDKIIYYWGTNNDVQEDFHLQLGSPCIDVGTINAPGLPGTDFDGNLRIINDIVDMGAFEYTGGPTNQPPVAKCQDIEVELDANGEATISTLDVDNGSSDPDEGDTITLSIDITNFTYADLEPNTVTLTVTDDSDASGFCTATVTVVDETPPVIQMDVPETITPPDAPISFTATATDNCEVTSVEITGYDCYKFTKKEKRVDKTESCVVQVNGDTITIVDSGGVGDNIIWTVTATDTSGNTTEKIFELLVVNPGKGKGRGKK